MTSSSGGWKRSACRLSPAVDDAGYLRRLTLDLTGQLPTPDEVRAFLAIASPSKRESKIDELMGRREFQKFWGIKLGDLLQITTGAVSEWRGLLPDVAREAARRQHAVGPDGARAADSARKPQFARRRRCQLRARWPGRQDPRRANGPAVSGPSLPVRSVPRSSVRRLDSGPVLRPGRLLRQGRAWRRRRWWRPRHDGGTARRLGSTPRRRSCT